MTTIITNILSCIGAIFLLIGLRVRKKEAVYGLVNFIGGIFLVVTAILLANIGFVVLNLIWIGVGLKIFLKRNEDKKDV